MHSFDCVLFDLDGTLLDTAPEFAVVVNRLRAEHGLPALPYAPIRATVSDGARALTRLALSIDEQHERFEPARLRLLALYNDGLGDHTEAFPGTLEVLAHLARRGLPWGVVTNKPSTLAAPLMARMAFAPREAVLVCPDTAGVAKPDPRPLLLACEQLDVAPARTLYVGDHRRDIDAARAAGMPSVAAAWGYIHEDDPAHAWGADHCLAEMAGLLDLLEP